MVWRAGGGSCGAGEGSGGLESRGTQEDIVTNASGEWRCNLNGGPSHFVPQLLFNVNFFLFDLYLTFSSFFRINYFNLYNTYFLSFFKNLLRAFLPFTFFSLFYFV